MAWDLLTIPGAGTIATIAGWATKVVNNFRYLKGLDGVVTIQAGLIVDNALGTEYLQIPSLTTTERGALTPVAGMLIYNETTTKFNKYENGAWREDLAYNGDISLLQITSQAEGDILYRGASAWARLGKGTALKYLRQNAALTAPEWALPTTPTIVRKTADQTVNNSTTLVNDTHLLFAVLASEIWELELLVKVNSSAVADWKIAFTLPAAATMLMLPSDKIGGTSGSNLTDAVDATTSRIYNHDGGSYNMLWLKAIYVGGANAGNIQLQWAQNTAEVSDTKVLANSYLIAHKLN